MNGTGRLLAIAFTSALASCSSSSPAAVTVSQLAVGDVHCPNGGVAVTSGATTAYACTGASGAQGAKGDTGLTGAQGVQGVPGVPGGGYYTKLSDAYCRSAMGISDNSGTLGASCDQPLDLPIAGSCVSGDERVAVVVGSDPVGWGHDGSSSPAGWVCTYGHNGVTLATPYAAAKATVCCIKHP